ncbi:MAG: hypothetical protein RLZZ299_999 [Pseudomonadota bacterium]
MPVKLLCILGVSWAGEVPHPSTEGASTGAAATDPVTAPAEPADLVTAARLPVLRAPEGPQRTGELVSFVLEAPDARPVYVDGCTPIDLEVRTSTGWTREPTPSCAGGDLALRVDRALTLSVVIPRPGTWRASVAWGAGCHPKTPFAYASCSQTGTARSERVEVSGFPLPPEGR